MRLYFKKVVTFSAGIVFFVCFIALNYETQKQRVAYQGDTPWGINFHSPSSDEVTDYKHRILQSVVVENKSHEHTGSSYVQMHRDQTNIPLENTRNNTGETLVSTNVHNISKHLTSSSEVRFSSDNNSRLWYDEDHDDDDRIIAQMNRVEKSRDFKTILVYQGFSSHVRSGTKKFIDDKCPTNKCILTSNRFRQSSADAIMFHQTGFESWPERPAGQVWIMYLLESPYHTPSFSGLQGFNWTATYRHDSTLVTPYERFRLYDQNVKIKPQTKNYATGKTKKVAWFVSNCATRNGRHEYVAELAKYIEVDIYGACGPLKCSRWQHADKCFKMLDDDYKFYLSFENSNCRDYITEKFFVNGLGRDVLPVVMGAPKMDYDRVAPHQSFIHVDDFESPKHLAEYLNALDKNDTMYNDYFQWKGTGEFINTYFWCRLCALVHAKDHHPPVSYDDLNDWWRGDGVCIGKESWRSHSAVSHNTSIGVS